MPDWITKEVKKDNMDFIVDRLVFDDNFFTMIKQIFDTISG